MNRAKLIVTCVVFPICLSAQQAQGPLTDQRIMSLVGAGVSTNEILRIIGTAPEIDFQLSPVATDAMMKAGVSAQIIRAMAARESGTVAPPVVSVRKDYSTPISVSVPSGAIPSAKPALTVGGPTLGVWRL